MSLDCANKQDEERYKSFIIELIDSFYSNPVTAYEMLVGVMEEYLRMLDRSPSGMNVPKDIKPVDEAKEKDIRSYLAVLEEMKSAVESCRLIRAFLLREAKQTAQAHRAACFHLILCGFARSGTHRDGSAIQGRRMRYQDIRARRRAFLFHESAGALALPGSGGALKPASTIT